MILFYDAIPVLELKMDEPFTSKFNVTQLLDLGKQQSAFNEVDFKKAYKIDEFDYEKFTIIESQSREDIISFIEEWMNDNKQYDKGVGEWSISEFSYQFTYNDKDVNRREYVNIPKDAFSLTLALHKMALIWLGYHPKYDSSRFRYPEFVKGDSDLINIGYCPVIDLVITEDDFEFVKNGVDNKVYSLYEWKKILKEKEHEMYDMKSALEDLRKEEVMKLINGIAEIKAYIFDVRKCDMLGNAI